jgi:hypothetical protein
MQQSRTRIRKDPPTAPPTLDGPQCRKSLATCVRRSEVVIPFGDVAEPPQVVRFGAVKKSTTRSRSDVFPAN